jgi:hypothetical protein
MAKAPADQAAEDRLQDGLAAALGLIGGGTCARLGRVDRGKRGECLERPRDRQRALHVAPVGKLERRHRGAPEAAGEERRRAQAGEQLDVEVGESLSLEHPAPAITGWGSAIP